jgi:CPA1 family monovalent cation:H+ antiporter
MLSIELVLWLLLLTVAFAWCAHKVAVPYPVILVLGGLAIGLVPGLPRVALDPDVALILFLPPILYQAAIFTSWRDFRADLRSISLLAVGLVIATTVTVAWVAVTLVPGLPWPVAMVLGAIVSPPDAVAATAVLARLKVPRRVVTILEGESLVNDASALVIYKFAVVAAVSGAFSFTEAMGSFAVVGAGGIGVGLALGWVSLWLHRHVSGDPDVAIAASLVTPYAAFMAAEALHVSGVLAVVTAGLVRGWYAPERFGPRMRMQAHAVWHTFVFLLNGIVFILIGFELSRAVALAVNFTVFGLIWPMIAVTLTAVAVRLVWVFGTSALARAVPSSLGREPPLPWKQTTIIAWCGMRGVVSLAAALALPLTNAEGAPLLGRELVILMAFGVIFTTLAVQGLSLPFVIRTLRVGIDSKAAREERVARLKATHAAIAEIDRMARAELYPVQALEPLRGEYKRRLMELRAFARASDSVAADAVSQAWRGAHKAAIAAERRRVLKLRRDRIIGDEVLRRIQYELDLEEVRLG